MIATALIFLSGALVTLLLALLLTPLVWRKAQSLARKRFEATIPTTANEIGARLDHVRAEAAMTVRRGEIAQAKAQAKTARSQIELGRTTVENVALLKRNRLLIDATSAHEAEIARLRTELGARDGEKAALTQALAASKEDAETTHGEVEALGRRFVDLGEIAERNKIQSIAAESRLDGVSDMLRSNERELREAKAEIERLERSAENEGAQEIEETSALKTRIETLLAGIADRDTEIERRAAEARSAEAIRSTRIVSRMSSPASAGQRLPAGRRLRNGLTGRPEALSEETAADIREQISDVAARVIRMTALAEGPDSPIARLVEKPADQAADQVGGLGDTPPSLAERVRRLVEADASRAQPAGGAE